MHKLFISIFPFVIILLIWQSNKVISQTTDPIALALEYYDQGDMEKARSAFEDLIKNRANVPFIHDQYLAVLLNSNENERAENYLKGVAQSFNNYEYKIDLATLYKNTGREQFATEYLDQLIEKLTNNITNNNDINQIRILASQLFDANFREKALQAYIQTRNQLDIPDLFSLDLGRIYAVMGEKEKMIREYLLFSKSQPRNVSYVKNAFQRYLEGTEDYELLEANLYTILQKEAGVTVYNDLLVWTHLQQLNFSAALRQATALDLRSQNEGMNMVNVGLIAFQNEDYLTAERAFQQIIQRFPEGRNNDLSKKYLLLAEEEVIKNTFPLDTTAIYRLIEKHKFYQESLQDIYALMDSQRRVALMFAFELNQLDTAIHMLSEVVKQPVGKHEVLARAKMDLADIYLLDEQEWESILLYAQVEKLFKDEPLGYEAKLRSAKLSYYKGEFELARGYLDILKLATSREIANDALDLSVLIRNNTIFDSTDVVMQDYALIELLLFQNQKEQAISALQTMLEKYEKHSIIDEVLYLKAKTHRELGEFEEAISSLTTIVTSYDYDILADDALFMRALIYEENLKINEKAQADYQELLRKYPGSIFVAESRSRFRNLRGDFNN